MVVVVVVVVKERARGRGAGVKLYSPISPVPGGSHRETSAGPLLSSSRDPLRVERNQ